MNMLLEKNISVDDEEACCFICLDGARDHEPLIHPCSCPRQVHRVCLAKWQLHSAGQSEETRCRFCHQVLPDWRPALTPNQLKPAASVMSVRYRGVTYRITYTPGPDGLQHFLKTLQEIGIKVASASQVTFLCRSPDTGEEMSLKGLKAFDAAAYCASITAAKRVLRDADKRQHKQSACRQQQADPSQLSEHEHDLGVRHEGPDSPRAASGCDGGAGAGAASGAAAGPVSSIAASAVTQAHADRAHAAFYTSPISGYTAPLSQYQHGQLGTTPPHAECWWRRALKCVGLPTHLGVRHSVTAA